MEFEKLDLNKYGQSKSWFQVYKKSIIFAIAGAIAANLYYFYTEGQYIDNILWKEILSHSITGLVIGYFVANNPCANNRC